MSRFISGVMGVVLILIALVIQLLSCSPVNIIGTALGDLSTFLTGLPTTSTCYALLPPVIGVIAGIVLTVLGGIAVAATVLG